jgi:hypothetical protein
MKTAAAQLPPAGENRNRRKIHDAKNSAGRMGWNPYDPLTTTNLRGVDHG